MKNKIFFKSFAFIPLVMVLNGCSFSKNPKNSYKESTTTSLPMAYEDTLIEKIRTGTAQEIQEVIGAKINLNIVTKEKCETPLVVAVNRGNPLIVKIVFEKGASPFFLPECVDETSKVAFESSELIKEMRANLQAQVKSLLLEDKIQLAINFAQESLMTKSIQADLFSSKFISSEIEQDGRLISYLKELLVKADYLPTALKSFYFKTLVQTLRSGAKDITQIKKVIDLLGKKAGKLEQSLGADDYLVLNTESLLRTFNHSTVAQAVRDYNQLSEKFEKAQNSVPEIYEDNVAELISLVQPVSDGDNEKVLYYQCEIPAELDINSDEDHRSRVLQYILFSRGFSPVEYHSPYVCAEQENSSE